MKSIQKVIVQLLFFGMGFSSLAQNAKLKGIILDENKQAVAHVSVSNGAVGTQSNSNGFYELPISANKKTTVVFTHISLKSASIVLFLKPNENFEFNPVMNTRQEQMGEVVVTAKDNKRIQGITSITPEVLRKIPGANAGVENILKTLAGVNSNSELSTQYAVRGGNYDENLVYVNEIEVYRPFLIRSGQQEGLSFTNTDLVQKVDFSAGGFQSKYGDKMASVLDISYRKPTKFGLAAQASFLGGSVAVEGVSKNQKWSYLTGIRYRDNSLLVNSQETQTNFKPSFADVQTSVIFNSSTKWQWNFLGNISQNNYNYQPLTRQTNFGTIDEPIALQIFYEGQEKINIEPILVPLNRLM